MNYIGKSVRHITMGDGIVVDQKDNKIIVQFEDREVMFIYPDAFKKFLSFTDTSFQEIAVEKIAEKDEKKLQAELKEKAEIKELQRLDRNTKTVKTTTSAKTGYYILNFQGPTDYEELEHYYYENDEKTNLEELLNDIKIGKTIWSVPQYVEPGDLILFYCAATSTDTYHLGNAIYEAKLENNRELVQFGEEEKRRYKQYAGRIMCTGVVTSYPYTIDMQGYSRNLLWADVEYLQSFDNPILVRDINDYVKINRYNSVTALKEEQWERLLKDIIKRNPSFHLKDMQ